MTSSVKNAVIRFNSKIFLLLSVCQVITAVGLVVMLFNDLRTPPIQCLLTPNMKAIETFCYIQSSFTLRNVDKKYELHPGVGVALPEGGGSPTYQRYFFWLPYLLSAQVLMFGFPRYLWKVCEGGFLTRFLSNWPPIPNENQMKPQVNYFILTMHHHKSYALHFIGCELSGLSVLLANIFITNWYLEGRFLQTVPLLLKQLVNTSNEGELFDETFPKVSKCTFYWYGGSGSANIRDTLCVMARNLITGRLYMILYIVFLTSACIALLSFVWRLLSLSCASVRSYSLMKKVPEGSKDDLHFILERCDFGDWFILLQMASVANFTVYIQLLRQQLEEQNDAETFDNIDMLVFQRTDVLPRLYKSGIAFRC